MKGIAVSTIFIIFTTVIFLFFAVIMIFGFINVTGLEASQASCSVKLTNYCITWAAKGFDESNKPYKWNEKSPDGCSTYLKDVNDASGPTKEKCVPIVK